MAKELALGVDPEQNGGPDEELEALRTDADVAHVLLGFSAALAEVRTVDATLDIAMKMTPAIMGGDRCFVASLDRSDQRLYVTESSGFTEEELRAFEELAQAPGPLTLLRRAMQERAPVMVEDAGNDPRIPPEDAARRRLGAYIGIPLIRRGEEFGGIGIEYRGSRSFGIKDKALARGIARHLGVALVNAHQFSMLSSLSRFGLRIATRFRLQTVSEEVARGAADLLGGGGARLYLADTSRRALIPAAASGRVPHGYSEPLDIDVHPWRGLAEGRTVTVSETGEEPAAVVAVPVPGADGALLGAIVVFSEHHVPLGPHEIDALNVLASQSALAIDNAQRFERQRRVARSLQRGLLSTETPDILVGRVAAVYEPANAGFDVGGDFYDIFELDDDVFGLVVGDVSGKGAEAAVLTAQAKYMLRAFASRNRTPSSVLFHLNNALVASLDDDRFATLVYVLYDVRDGTCVLSNGGHPSPLIYRAAERSVASFDLPGTVLGAFQDEQFEQLTFGLARDDVLLAYTDGLTEARNELGEMFGRRRVESALVELAPTMAPTELPKAVYARALEFGRVTDDTVVFALASPGN